MTLATQMPNFVPHCLRHLTTIDELKVIQRPECCPYSDFNYTIKNKKGGNLYEAVEETNSCIRCEKFSVINIMDKYEIEAICLHRRKISRPFCCLPISCRSLQVLEVCSPPGNLVAVVEEVQNSLATEIDIKSANGDVILKIEGPKNPLFNRSFWLRDIVFEVLSADKSDVIGGLTKQWVIIWMKKTVQFKVSLPLDLDVRMKAALIAACILIDLIHFSCP